MNILPSIKKSISCIAIVLLSCFLVSFYQKNTAPINSGKTKKVLIFSKTNGFRHESIPAGIAAIKKLGSENNFLVDATEDSLAINSKNLKKYQAVIFLSASGNVLGEEQKLALQQFIEKGNGFVGIHSATNCEPDWDWYTKMIGGIFEGHPEPQNAKLIVVDHKHPSTKHLPEIWERKDEWYNFKYLNPNVKVLIKIDESSYNGGKHGNNHPLAWYHDYDGGRAFYTALGHSPESYSDPLFVQHLLGGIMYAMGK
ncbi:ThuA domain-containing protein [Flavobacterium sp. KACC 22761]|uniref:ThuA domain-containing protein n=1 Tax=Flavobacterium sp. KACC 22761 TaxID=3092665 RepID=UPI002A766BDD|nr:ThuA domain-containing protein [Flavobacterium sp. KACC 22761]WPO76831.1 ThuA domain-containing protein [Flavobacterium sp. KACC 22761]